MNINERVRLVRKSLKMNQKEFGEKIIASQNYLSNIEIGQREVTEKIIKLICFEFNVNEEWLRTGKGEMFIQHTTFSLDEYAQQKHLTELELNIIKRYMELDPHVREELLKMFNNHLEITATTEEDPEIEEEVMKYRQQLKEDKKIQRSLASQEQKKYG